jgi:hypothetical protein
MRAKDGLSDGRQRCLGESRQKCHWRLFPAHPIIGMRGIEDWDSNAGHSQSAHQDPGLRAMPVDYIRFSSPNKISQANESGNVPRLRCVGDLEIQRFTVVLFNEVYEAL